MPNGLKNISLRLFRDYFEYKGLKNIRNKGGHEVWSRKNLLRPIILQSPIDPIPEFIVKANLKTLGETAEDFYRFMEKR